MNKIKLIKKFQEPDGAIELQVTLEQNDKKDSNKKTRKLFKQLETDFVSLVPKDHPAKDAMSAPAEWLESILRETGEYKDNYYDNGSEAYSRLLDVRHYNKLNPKKRNWTEKSVKKLIKKSAKKLSDYNDYQLNFLNRYKPSTIARIFNEVAQANPSNLDVENTEQLYGFDPTNGIGYVKQGAKITSKVKKFQNPSGPLRSKWDKANEYAAPVAKAASSFIPLVGTYLDYKAFKENPTWGNAGWLALSALGDALTLSGVGAGAGTAIKAGRAARVANAAYDTVNAVRRTGNALDTMADASKAVDAVLKVKTSYDLTNSYINT